jgi:ubiquinone/menaquinone biosynthesis C-methylase UbiE
LDDLVRLIGPRRQPRPVVIDVGCGWGRSLKLLDERFAPSRLIAVDIDSQMLSGAIAEADRSGISAEFELASSSDLPLTNESVDVLLCHQTFHHLVEQERTLLEFHRVLKPSGLLLFAESTRAYIHSWIIRLLFRHPMDVQRTASEYVTMIRRAGFSVEAEAISYPYHWWSRADLGIIERWFGIQPQPNHEETLVNLVAVRQ